MRVKKAAMNSAASILLSALMVLLAAALGYAVLSLPGEASGLSRVVASQMGNSGVDHSVTAVLLSFRGYDTLLEMAVLLLALLGVWSLAANNHSDVATVSISPVLAALLRLLAPVMILWRVICYGWEAMRRAVHSRPVLC
ncbi:MAG: hypothetical protein COB33_015315 [Thiotrichaceae bacterium]|nr:hypothetical protein [Thiotrichaceae bacterium]